MSKRNYGNLQFGPRDEVAYADVCEWLDSIEPYKRMAAVKRALQFYVQIKASGLSAVPTSHSPEGIPKTRARSRSPARQSQPSGDASARVAPAARPSAGGARGDDQFVLDDTAKRLASDLASMFGSFEK